MNSSKCKLLIKDLVTEDLTCLPLETDTINNISYNVPVNSYLLELLIEPITAINGSFTFNLNVNNNILINDLLIDSGELDITKIANTNIFLNAGDIININIVSPAPANSLHKFILKRQNVS